jgi:hypothetical protein
MYWVFRNPWLSAWPMAMRKRRLRPRSVSQSIGPDLTLIAKLSDDLKNAKRPPKVMYFYWDRMIAKKIRRRY